MRLEHHLVGGYVRYISPHIIIIIIYLVVRTSFHWHKKLLMARISFGILLKIIPHGGPEKI